ncbi:MAG: hypothetical protein U0793_06340 [Gemmataceae bacterium]
MLRTAQTLSVLSLFLVLAALGTAGDAEKEAGAILDKAIKAHFPKGIDTKNKGLRTKSAGKIHVMGVDLDFTQQVSVQAASKFKEAIEMTFMGKTINVTTVFNGKDAWIKAGDKDIKVTEEIMGELKDAAYVMGLMQGLFFKDKGLKFSLLGEHKFKGKASVGVNVSREGKKDVSLFFDKTTGLLSKVEIRKRDIMSGMEVQEERFILDYQDVEGRKVAKKVEVLRDGKEFLEAEVTEVQILEKLGDDEFAQPK